MQQLVYQNNELWRDKKLGRSQLTIGSHGCLITSLCNIYNMRSKNFITPDTFNGLMTENHGINSQGLVIWNIAEIILKAKIEHIYKGAMTYDVNSYYIVNFLLSGHGHFTNLLEISGDKYFIYDVWDASYKVLKAKDIRRVVKVIYS